LKVNSIKIDEEYFDVATKPEGCPKCGGPLQEAGQFMDGTTLFVCVGRCGVGKIFYTEITPPAHVIGRA
jgi:hypothetical protein